MLWSEINLFIAKNSYLKLYIGPTGEENMSALEQGRVPILLLTEGATETKARDARKEHHPAIQKLKNPLKVNVEEIIE